MSGHHRKERYYTVEIVETERETLLACMDYALGRGPRPDGPRLALVDLAYRFDRMPERSDRTRAGRRERKDSPNLNPRED